MAQKEATVYIVDCGQTMGKRGQSRRDTDLDWALQYVWDKITTTVATARKTALAGVVGLRTDETNNPLQNEEHYANIAILQPIDQILMPDLRKLSENLRVSATDSGDAISAIVVAMQMIADKCKMLQYQRRIFLVTDARGAMDLDPENLKGICDKLVEDRIELFVLGVDFDDAEFGFKEEDKDPVKAENEAVLRKLCEDCGGSFGTLAQAIEELQIPRIKTVRPVPSYKGLLTLGNPEIFDTALCIDVERYPKVMVASAPTASKFVTRAESHQAQMTSNDDSRSVDGGLAVVKHARTYQVDDEHAPGGKREVDADDLQKGYEYGRTAVHIAESDGNVTQYDTKQSFDILGFVEGPKYERFFDMSKTCLTISQRGNNKASMALSSFIHALHEMDSYAVARLVLKDMKDPKLVLLAPEIKHDFECLYDVELPFSEDVRNYRFPPLDRVVTVSGKELKVHRNLPSDELNDAIDGYVDAMDLSTFAQDEQGSPTEYAKPEDTYNLALHRLNQVIRHRAVYPEAEPPSVPDILLRYSVAPEELIKGANPYLQAAITAGAVKRVPPKARGKRLGRNSDTPKPLSDLDVAALLARDSKGKSKVIDPLNAIPGFKQAVNSAEEIQQLDDACEQLRGIIFDWIRTSVGHTGYARSVEAIGVMREEMVDMDHPKGFNEALKALKAKVFSDELGGDRSEFWFSLRSKRLQPIRKDECPNSEYTEDSAKAFMSMKR